MSGELHIGSPQRGKVGADQMVYYTFNLAAAEESLPSSMMAAPLRLTFRVQALLDPTSGRPLGDPDLYLSHGRTGPRGSARLRDFGKRSQLLYQECSARCAAALEDSGRGASPSFRRCSSAATSSRPPCDSSRERGNGTMPGGREVWRVTAGAATISRPP